MIEIGIVTVTYNSGVFLPEFLKCLSQQTFRNFKIYAIDNNSTDNSKLILANYEPENSEFEYTCLMRNIGVAGGNNIGIRQALKDECQYILLLNNDTKFEDNFLEKLFVNTGNFSIITPKILYDNPSDMIWYCGGSYSELFKTSFHDHFKKSNSQVNCNSKYVSYAPTCALLVHSPIFKLIGGFDNSFF